MSVTQQIHPICRVEYFHEGGAKVNVGEEFVNTFAIT